jgi:hypothetical protein
MKWTAVRKQWKQDCSVTILSWCWTPKIWATLPAFYPLLIRFYLPSGLEVIEFRRSTSLLISVSGQNSGWTELNFRVSDWSKLQKYRIPSWYETLSDFQWSITWPQTVSDLRVTTVGNSTGLLNQNSGQTGPFGLNQDFGKILPWPSQKL